MQSILADTGPLVAFAKKDAPAHARVKAFIRRFRGRLLTTWPVLTEIWHLAPEHTQIQFLRWADAGGLVISDLGPDALARMLPWLEKYHDRPMDLADASLVLLAEKTGITDVLTLDRADFDIYRTPSGKPFRNLLA